jgi:fructokinase
MRPVSDASRPSDRPLIVVGGEALVDLIARVDGGLRAVLGGGPYNTARTIGRLGGHVAFLGGISTDRFGTQLREALIAAHVSTELVQSTEAPTTLAMAELDERGAASYRFYFEGTAAPALEPIVAPRQLGALHVGTLGLVLEPMATVLEDLVRQVTGHTLVIVDVNCRPSATPDAARYLRRVRSVVSMADVVKVSDDDLSFLRASDAELGSADDLLRLGARVVLLTRGGDGVDVITSDGSRYVPAEPVEVVDTIGAGDSFGGGFLAWWARSGLGVADLGRIDAIEEAVTMACRVAAITCGREGADPPFAAEVAGWSQ